MPLWLDEGLAFYLASQKYDSNQEIKYCLDYYSKHSIYEHKEAPLVIEKLLRNYGQESFVKFLNKIKGHREEIYFKKSFEEHFNIELNYERINSLK